VSQIYLYGSGFAETDQFGFLHAN